MHSGRGVPILPPPRAAPEARALRPFGGRTAGQAMPVVPFIHELRFADLPAEVRRQAKRCLLDLIGVAASGDGTRLSRIVRDFAASQLGTGGRGARMLFDGRSVSPAGA